MVSKAYDITSMDAETYEKYFKMLHANRRQRIRDMKTDEERIHAVACEMLARQCLSELTDAPAFAFNLLIGINKVCVVSNFSAFFGLGKADDFLCCAADTVPVGIDCRRVQPFLFSDAQKLFSDAELRYVFSKSKRSFADIVQNNMCTLAAETEEYWKLYSLKEAYFNACGRVFRNLRDIHFSFTAAGIQCEDARFAFGGTFRSDDGRYVYSIIKKIK